MSWTGISRRASRSEAEASNHDQNQVGVL